MAIAKKFLLTRPLRGATQTMPPQNRYSFISTHTPLAGRDRFVCNFSYLFKISTHTPLAGRDTPYPLSFISRIISTHTPLAGRDWNICGMAGKFYISTHTPLAGRDLQQMSFLSPAHAFLLTRPLRGATYNIAFSVLRLLLISTHTPLAGRDWKLYHTFLVHHISTHTPLAGRDICFAVIFTIVYEFLLTRPLRGATDKGTYT